MTGSTPIKLAREKYLWVYVCLVVPSIAPIHVVFGLSGVGLYAGGMAAAVFIVLPRVIGRLLTAEAGGRRLGAVAALGTIITIVVFAAATPRTARVVGFGSDRNEALTLAVTRLLHGFHPYTESTSLGHPITPLPGALLITAPVVYVTGNAAWLNALAWAATLWVLCRMTRRPRLVLALQSLAWTSVYLLYEVLLGEDLLSNTLVCLLAVAWFGRVAGDPALPLLHRASSAIFLGLSLSSRLNFLPLGFLAVASAAARGSLTLASRAGVVSALVWLTVTVPLYLYAPSKFSPLERLQRGFALTGSVGSILFLIAVMIAALLARRLYWEDIGRSTDAEQPLSDVVPGYRLMRDCAVIQAVQVGGLFLMNSLNASYVRVGTLGYGIFFACFGLFASVLGLAAGMPHRVGMADRIVARPTTPHLTDTT